MRGKRVRSNSIHYKESEGMEFGKDEQEESFDDFGSPEKEGMKIVLHPSVE